MPPAIHVTCPFLPCKGKWWVGADLGESTRIPQHHPIGMPATYTGWLPWCPGAGIFVRKSTSHPFNEPDVAKLQRALSAYQARLRAIAAGDDLAGAPYVPLAELIEHGRPADPTNEYFPGRPADAPEPGTGEPPAAPVQIGTGHHLGRAEMDNSHSTTQGLVGLAINQMGLTQDLLARITAAIDEGESLAVAAESQVRAVQSLVISAVGTGADAGDSGEAMAEHVALAVDTISGEANIGQSLALAKLRVETAHLQLVASIVHARDFLARLG